MKKLSKKIHEISADRLEALRTRAGSVKMVATDLDGTLLDREHSLRDETGCVLKALAEKGVILVAATGRARTSIPETVTNLHGLKYLITANGAKIFLNDTGELIFEKYLNPGAIDFIRPFFHDPEVMLEVFWDGTPHVEEARYNAARDFGIPKWFSDYFFNSRKPLKGIETAVAEHINEIENINFVFANEIVQNRVYDFLAPRTDLYELTSSFPFNYEIGGIGVSKGAAVGFIARRENVLPEETLCFGDQDNDVTMIEFAGIGIATANGSERALSAASLVTLDNEQEGVARALKALGLV